MSGYAVKEQSDEWTIAVEASQIHHMIVWRNGI
jgi:hypothetical protein